MEFKDEEIVEIKGLEEIIELVLSFELIIKGIVV